MVRVRTLKKRIEYSLKAKPIPIALVPDDASLPRSRNFPDRFSMVLRSESDTRKALVLHLLVLHLG